ncbi:hypothetical protein PCE1_001228 [Barthelona sp. PCE]
MNVSKLALILAVLLVASSALKTDYERFQQNIFNDAETANDDNPNVNTLWFDQTLDHLDDQDQRTFKQRYYSNLEFCKTDECTIFIQIGGEAPESDRWVQQGYMYELARKLGDVALYDLEHRYYGKSTPFEDYATHNLHYLTSKQAVRDLAKFAQYLKTIHKGKIAAFGGSYPGNLAAWIVEKHPDVFDCTLSASGPVEAKDNYFEYGEQIDESLLLIDGYYPCCHESTALAMKEIQSMDIETLNAKFNTCHPVQDKMSFWYAASDGVAGPIQYASSPKYPQFAYCDGICNAESATDYMIERVRADLGAAEGECADVDVLTQLLDNEDTSRLWFYQKCNEFGYFKVGEGIPTWPNLDLPWFHTLCEQAYGKLPNIKDTNDYYKGLNPENVSEKVFFTQGLLDPWRRLGIGPTHGQHYNVGQVDTAHCAPLYASNEKDHQDLVLMRKTLDNFFEKCLA